MKPKAAHREHTPRANQLWLLPTAGQAGQHLVADVALPLRTTRLYTYAVPPELRATISPGVMVRVPYGKSGRPMDGFCLRLTEREWKHTRRPILEILNPESFLTPALIELGLWVSDYYACPPGRVFLAMLPATLRNQRFRKVVYLRAAHSHPASEMWDRSPTVSESQAPSIEEKQSRPETGSTEVDPEEAGLTDTNPAPKTLLTEKQRALLAVVAQGDIRRNEALQKANAGVSALQALRKLKLIEVVVRREPVKPNPDDFGDAGHSADDEPRGEDAYALTPGQQAALDAISQVAVDIPAFTAFLLFGVPGSGKTEVYVRAIRRVIRAGRQAILMVPEIMLATQVVERLVRRFKRVAVLHSQLTDKTRARTLRAIAAGKVDVVIGTRTAVFAPCPRLGLLVVDEEQEGSFKSLAAPFYHARDVSLKRAQLENVPVIMGSATPSLETWYNANNLSHFKLLRLPERVPGARFPDVRLVDTSKRELGQTTTVLWPELIAQLRSVLAADQQAILLHNRRGQAAFLRCARCRLMVRCERCGAHMIFHQGRPPLIKCHRCGQRAEAPTQCLDNTCGGRIEHVQWGIQHLEEELRFSLPNARLLRLDSDTMRHRDDYQDALQRFEGHEADILLGTQMVAKGLDFPLVRLVGVIEAEAALSLPDFRAAERVFQLLVQVVGRAGRREGDSLALVQSADVNSPAIREAIRMDYEAFAAGEMPARRELFYPPYARMVRCVCADARPGRARSEAKRLAETLRTLAGQIHAGIRVDDAAPCAVARLRKMFRFQIIIRAPRDGGAQKLLREATMQKMLSPRVQRFTIDVDPVDLL